MTMMYHRLSSKNILAKGAVGGTQTINRLRGIRISARHRSASARQFFSHAWEFIITVSARLYTSIVKDGI
jgi:hypothetical protein